MNRDSSANFSYNEAFRDVGFLKNTRKKCQSNLSYCGKKGEKKERKKERQKLQRNKHT